MSPSTVSEQSSPLTREQAEHLNRLAAGIRPEQAHWIAGYLVGLSAGGTGPAAASLSLAEPGGGGEAPVVTVLAGSQTGNALDLAGRAAERLREAGFGAEVQDMAAYKSKRLREESWVLVITSTHGEGEPPDSAADLHEHLHSRKAPKLAGMGYAVLGLGDRSYDHFCQTGKDFDRRLEELGADRLLERADCDVDYADTAEAWLRRLTEALAAHAPAAPPASVKAAPSADTAESEGIPYSRKHPFPATVLENRCLTGRGSAKEVRHVELSLEGSGLTYQPGDSLGVFPVNRPEAVTEVVTALGLDGEASVAAPNGEEVPLTEALSRHYEIRLLAPPVVAAWAELADSDELRGLAAEANRQALRAYTEGRDLIDLVRDYPAPGVSAAELVAALRPLQPRLYSLASSPSASPDEAHLTVGVLHYRSHGRDRFGVASNWIAGSVAEGDTLSVYVQPNPQFRLPADPSAPVIMVGPGTGVAPFRAFLEEREEQGADGPNWLFFGEQHFRTDFLYQTDWQRWRREGLLDRIDLAFSRDASERVYVQDRIRERASEVYQWLEAGAHVYVCGDAEAMAPAVHQALVTVFEREGGLSPEAASDWLKALQREKRYQRDVY